MCTALCTMKNPVHVEQSGNAYWEHVQDCHKTHIFSGMETLPMYDDLEIYRITGLDCKLRGRGSRNKLHQDLNFHSQQFHWFCPPSLLLGLPVPVRIKLVDNTLKDWK